MAGRFRVTPFGVPLREVARVLGRSYDWTRRNLAALGFTARTRGGARRANGRPVFVPPGELAAFLDGGIDRLRAYKRERRVAAAGR